jgi:hypothetical protein
MTSKLPKQATKIDNISGFNQTQRCEGVEEEVVAVKGAAAETGIIVTVMMTTVKGIEAGAKVGTVTVTRTRMTDMREGTGIVILEAGDQVSGEEAVEGKMWIRRVISW